MSNPAIAEVVQEMREELSPANLEDGVSFLRMGNKTYSLTPLEDGVDVGAELRAYINGRLERVEELAANGLVWEVDEQRDKHYERLTRLSGDSEVKVPREFIDNKIPSMVYEGRLCKVKAVIYKPWFVVGSYHEIKRYLPAIDTELTAEQMSQVGRGLINLTFEQNKINAPLMVMGETNRAGRVQALLRVSFGGEFQEGFHSRSSGFFCIGNHDNPQALFDMTHKQLGQELSKINLFSLGRAAYRGVDSEISLSDFLQNHTKNRIWQVIPQAPEGEEQEETAWTA